MYNVTFMDTQDNKIFIITWGMFIFRVYDFFTIKGRRLSKTRDINQTKMQLPMQSCVA